MKRHLISLARRFTRVLMRSDRVWEFARNLPPKEFFFHQRNPVIRKRAQRECDYLIADREVMAGPFKGLRYAETTAVGSMLLPKLVGTYESELHPILARLAESDDYDHVVDVGFAEGFYLIGLGRVFQNAHLVGFDVEDEAKRLCRENAKVNDIDDDRLSLFAGFDARIFRDVLGARSLVVVDCEGYENDVVESLSPEELGQADWIIETHDHLVSGTTERLRDAFRDTHEITEVITDLDLEHKLKLLPESVREQHNEYVQEVLVSENRKAKQSWLFAARKAA